MTFPLVKTRRRRQANEVAFLQANLSGGAAGMAWLYSVLGTVNTSGGVVDSIVDRLGLVPNLQATLTARPGFDAAALLVNPDGVNDNLSWTAVNAAGDFTSVKAIVRIAVYPVADNAKEFLGLEATRGTATNYLEGKYNTSIEGSAAVAGVPAEAMSGVVSGTLRRCVIISHNGSTTLTCRTLNHTAGTTTITTLASGNRRLTEFDFFPAGGSNTSGAWRANLGLKFEPTTSDLLILAQWAVRSHGVSLAA